jgi:hypothetical protein
MIDDVARRFRRVRRITAVSCGPITRLSYSGGMRASQSVLRRPTSIEPNGSFIERAELDEHFDGGRFPGLRRDASCIGFVNESPSRI